MPTAKQHRAAAARHLRAYRATVNKHPDWGAVMLFYAALHLLESAFDKIGIHNTTHSKRELFIKSSAVHSGIWPAYHRLETESMKTRYLQGGSFCMNAKAVDSELRRGKLAEVRRHVRAVLHPRVVMKLAGAKPVRQ